MRFLVHCIMIQVHLQEKQNLWRSQNDTLYIYIYMCVCVCVCVCVTSGALRYATRIGNRGFILFVIRGAGHMVCRSLFVFLLTEFFSYNPPPPPPSSFPNFLVDGWVTSPVIHITAYIMSLKFAHFPRPQWGVRKELESRIVLNE